MRKMCGGGAWRLPLATLGVIALLVSSTALAGTPVDANPVNDDYRGSTADVTIPEGELVNGDGGYFGNVNEDGTLRPGGGYLYISNGGGAYNDVTIDVNVSLSKARSDLTMSAVSTLANAYGPIMISGHGTAGSSAGTLDIAGFRMNGIATNVAVDIDALASASAWGGGLYVSRFDEVTIEQLSFDGVTLNATLADSGMGGLLGSERYHFSGGAVGMLMADNSEATLTHVNFSNNAVNVAVDSGLSGTVLPGGMIQANGGALAVRKEDLGVGADEFNILGGTFKNNKAANAVDGGEASGGAIWFDGTELNIENVAFQNNSASASGANGVARGGAIYAAGQTEIVLDSVTFSGNTANGERNAIYLEPNATVTFTGSGDSYDYDGIAGGTAAITGITMDSEGELHLYGDYTGFVGNIDLNDGTTYFNGAYADASGYNVTGSIDVKTDATIDFTKMKTGTTFGIGTDFDTAGDSTIVLKVGAANEDTGSAAVAVIGVNGTATIGSTNTLGDDYGVHLRGIVKENETYLLIRGGVGSTYAGVAANDEYKTLLATYVLRDNISANNLHAEITASKDVADFGWTRNQVSLGSYIDRLGNNNNSDLAYYLSGLEDEAASEALLRQALDTSSGDAYAGAAGAIAQWDRRGNTMLADRMNTIFWSDASYATYASAGSNAAYGNVYGYESNASGIWASVDGYHYKSDSNTNAGQAKTKGWGLSLGYDKLIADWIFGVAFRYGDNRLDVDERHARIDANSYSLSLYGGRRVCLGSSVLHVMGGLTGGYHDMDGKRTQILGAVHNRFSSDYSAKTLSAYVDTGLTFGDVSRFAVQPFVNVMWNGYWSNSFTEKGNSADRLRVNSDNDDWWSTSMGVRMMGKVADAVAVDVNAAWRHTYGKLSATNRMNFVGNGGDRWTVRGTPLERNEGVVGAGMTFAVSENVSLRASYDFSFGSGKARSHEGMLSIGVSF